MPCTIATTQDVLILTIYLLKNADAYGFGTKKTNEIIEANTKVMKELVYYIQYLGKKETGEPLPPFIDMS